MSGFGKDLLASLMMGLVLPGLLLNGAVLRRPQEETEPAAEPVSVSLPVKVRQADGEVVGAQMEEYLVGVLLAEMPASFEAEALKAQGVVARTYAWKAYSTGGKHGDGSICVSPGCCQAYRTEENYRGQGGREEDVEKIKAAVSATARQVLTYQGELIEATYFSCSGGSTEDAAAVWGKAVPYLQSVDSPGEEQAAYYRDEAVFSKEALEEKLAVELAGPQDEWIGKITYTRGGSVDTAVIGGKYYTGTEMRTKLGLRSAAFSVSLQDGAFLFRTKGFGHRVGMSQYGADAMAVKGCSYEEILAHYYQGTELTEISIDIDSCS